MQHIEIYPARLFYLSFCIWTPHVPLYASVVARCPYANCLQQGMSSTRYVVVVKQGSNVQVDSHKVANTATEHQAMPSGMAETDALRGVENHPQGVDRPTNRQQSHTAERQMYRQLINHDQR